MFDIGLQELIIIFVVALLVFGPKKLPEVGKTLGGWIIEIRKGIHNAKAQMESDFEESDKKRFEDIRNPKAADDLSEKSSTSQEAITERKGK